MNAYDLVVIGFGHAGCEAALAAARLGCRVLLAGYDPTRLAHMVCNPSIGGPGKAHLVSELDALGGFMGRNVDANHLQARVLNATKGTAVRGLRLQADKRAYEAGMRREVEAARRIDLAALQATELVVEDGRVAGVRFFGGAETACPRVVVATGVYLDARIVRGAERYEGGPAGSVTAAALSASLRALGFELGRLQTATPPRVRTRSLDLSRMQALPFDPGAPLFAPESAPARADQLGCYSVRTGERTIAAVRANLHTSPLVIGNIVNTGPRQCPSIDRKVINFPDKFDHFVFVEPEGADGEESYLQGLSSAMAPDGQLEVIRSLDGFAAAEVSRFGYGIEYDFVPPRQLHATLETKRVAGLYLAGQINGTSGYEEAAAQGLIAGANAALTLAGRRPLVLPRSLAYIGVLIDDLVTKEHREPYRMTTARAECRLSLAQETAHARLTPVACRLGLVGRDRLERFRAAKRRMFAVTRALKGQVVTPTPAHQAALGRLGSAPLRKAVTAHTLLKRPEVGYADLAAFGFAAPVELAPGEAERVVALARYEGYVDRERALSRETVRLARVAIPPDFDYGAVASLSKAARSALEHFRPGNLAQAGRLLGVTPADLARLALGLASPAGK